MYTLFDCQPKFVPQYTNDYVKLPADFLARDLNLSPLAYPGFVAIFAPGVIAKGQTHWRVVYFARNTSPLFQKAYASRALVPLD